VEFLEHHYRKTDYSFPNKRYVLRSLIMRSGSICTMRNKENNILMRVVQQISMVCLDNTHEYYITRVGTLIVATIYSQLIQNRYMFRSFTVLQCSHQHCVQPVASDVQVVGYL